MGSTKIIANTAVSDEVTILSDSESKTDDQQPDKKVKTAKPKSRSSKYKSARSQVDKTKKYDIFAAIELIKKLSYSKFAGTITAHLVVKKAGTSVDLSFPHSTGKSITVAIFDEKVEKQIEEKNINFDILLAKPSDMSKITKFARVLGPQGLMPNPKNGTLTDNPESKKKELEGGKITLKTEKKAPLIHIVVGKTDMDTKQLVENIQALFTVLKNKLVKCSISATMSPSIKVKIDN